MSDFELIEELTQRVEEVSALLKTKVELLEYYGERFVRIQNQMDELTERLRELELTHSIDYDTN